MILNIKDLKKLASKLNLAIERSKINPKSGWIELETFNNNLTFKVANFDYYLEASLPYSSNEPENLHVTLLSETFIPLISKLDVEYINLYEKLNSLYLETDSSSYTFPIIKELGKTKRLDSISFSKTEFDVITINGDDVASIASVNTKGLIDAVFAKEIQQFIYVDQLGAITFTENIYVNNFKSNLNNFKFLLNISQAKLLDIFKDYENVNIEFEKSMTFTDIQTTSNKVRLYTNDLNLVLITQTQDLVDKFPSIKLRALAENPEQTHVVIDKKNLDKALARLMIFDKKFDITVMDYSKLIFKQDEVELVSIKNKNVEKLKYESSQNVVEHESIIRFADLVKQLKAINSKVIDISFGSRPAIVINSDNIKQIIPEIRIKGD